MTVQIEITPPKMIASVAPLRNVMLFSEMIERVKNRAAGLPGMAVFHGYSGYGKSTAAAWNANRYDAVYVQLQSTWRPKKFTSAVLSELCIEPARTVYDQVDQICEELARSNRPLFIDEADFMVAGKMIEVARDIYEGSGAPVILIGEERLPQKLKKWERVDGRIFDWCAAQPADLKDVFKLAQIYAPDVVIGDDLARKILDVTHQSVRRIGNNLSRVGEFARLNDVAEVSLNDWGDRPFFTGEAPAARRF